MSARIWIVEDDDADAELLATALDQVKDGPVELSRCRDGHSAIERLNEMGSKTDAPDLIFMDLNLPDQLGTDVLEATLQSRQSAMAPVVMFTSSDDRRDIERAYALNVSAYVRKPDSFDGMVETVRDIYDFWLKRNLSPVKSLNPVKSGALHSSVV